MKKASDDLIDLSYLWRYILHIAKKRIRNNITSRHVYSDGNTLEILGAAGELAARIYFNLPLKLHTEFDNGIDLSIGDKDFNVKATKLTPYLKFRHLQWPETNPINCDAAIMTAVDIYKKLAKIVGYATKEELEQAKINRCRQIPCREIKIAKLHPAEDLMYLKEID